MQQIIKLMEDHGIQLLVKSGKVLVKEEMYDRNWRRFTSQWIDATEWTVEDANKWLGY